MRLRLVKQLLCCGHSERPKHCRIRSCVLPKAGNFQVDGPGVCCEQCCWQQRRPRILYPWQCPSCPCLSPGYGRPGLHCSDLDTSRAGCAQESKPSVLAATSSRWPFSERHPAQTKTLGFDMGALGPSVQDHTKWCTALHGPPAPWLKKPFPPSPLFPHNCFTLCTPCTLAHEAL
jgi:hypothetical protein